MALLFKLEKKEHQLKKPSRYFDKSEYASLFSRIKESEKQVGVAVADIDYIPFLEKSGVDFYKVIRNDITNTPLINALWGTSKPVYISTGMASEEEIKKLYRASVLWGFCQRA